MKPFESMQFRHSWRPYQARVLNAIHDHLDDKRIHIVAAPGAGKTTLGLEIFRVIGKPALVLSPTRVIRDQWIERIKDFTTTSATLDWVSNSLQNPKVLTSITYQSLHSKVSDDLISQEDEETLLEEDAGLKESEVGVFIKTLEEHKVQVLILDEAHHLRAEWWKALEKVREHLADIILVSLTATPPYDSEAQEWSRYEQLCGPIDEEISVPELVKAGTLCPHQDFVWACNATISEKKQIQEYDYRVATLCNTLFNSDDFQSIVLSHPWLRPGEVEDDIIREPKIAIALLSFIKAKNLPHNLELMTLLDLSVEDIPELGRHWWQVLIETILFSKATPHSETQEQFLEQLKKQLRASELLNKRELSLERSRRIERSLSLSSSKVLACGVIHQIEYRRRGDSLRQVVLIDYIRDEALATGLETGEINLGAWPVFKHITSSSPIPDQVGLLTGRICVVPTSKMLSLFNYIDNKSVNAEPIGLDGLYQRISGPLNQLTSAFTQLLMNGDIKVLIGTRSLLGEGWDAPAINSLILASSVGSFMLTNQMRGRAIRLDPKKRDKISSVWHLVAINALSDTGWSDYHSLRKRFETFVGLSEKDLTIENGFERMHITSAFSMNAQNEAAFIASINRRMIRRFRKLDEVGERWRRALTIDESARIIPSVKTNKVPVLRGLLLKQSLKYLLIQFTGVFFVIFTGIANLHARSISQLLLFLILGVVAGLIYTLPKTLSILKIVFRYLPVDGALKQIGKALLDALCQAGLIETSIRQLRLNVASMADGSFYISLSGCTFYESALFSDCLNEILSPIDNPRYLILREGRFLGTFREDYHAVPMKFSVKKELAQLFYKSWQKNVCLSELIYTRTEDGRKRLLKAKMKAFSSTFNDEVKRLDRWQ